MTSIKKKAALIPTHRAMAPRRAVVSLELLVVMPIGLILLLSIALMGSLLSHSNRVLQAADVGAQRASIAPRAVALVLIPDVISAVDQHLAAAGISTDSSNRQVIVEERVQSSTVASSGVNLYSPSDTLNIPTNSVRVTVAIKATALTSDLLANYGFSIANGYAFHRVLRLHNGPTL